MRGKCSPVFLTLLTTLAVLGQAPTVAASPLAVLIAPPEAAGVPPHIVAFTQEHVYEQLKTEGLQVVRASELSEELTPAQRKSILGCNRLEAACRIKLGEAAVTDVVMVTELVHFLSGYRVGLRAYATRDGELLAEYYVPGVNEDQLLDALTQASNKVVPVVVRTLRPSRETGPVAQAPPTSSVRPGEPAAGSVSGNASGEPARVRQGAPGWAWVPAAVGVVALGAGTLFMVQARGDYKALTDPRTSLGTEEALAVRDSGIFRQKLGAAAFGVGAVGLAATGVIYLVSGKSESPASVKPVASVGPSGGMVGLVGTLP